MGVLQLASRDLAGMYGGFSRTERPQPEVMLGAGTSGCTGTGLLENGSSLELRGISQQGRFLKEWTGGLHSFDSYIFIPVFVLALVPRSTPRESRDPLR